MKVVLNKTPDLEVVYSDKAFQDKVQFEFDPKSKLPNVNFAKKTIRFNRCEFINGIEFSLDLQKGRHSGYKLILEECYVRGKAYFLKLDGDIEITIINSVINDFIVSACTLKNLVLSRTLVLDRFLLQNTSVQSILLQNSLGNFFINDDGNCNCTVYFNDDNLFVEKDKVFEFYKKVTADRELESILYYPTVFNFNNLKSIDVNFSRFDNERYGFRIDEIPQLNAPNKKKVRYYATKEDLQKLQISISIDQSKGVTKSITIKNAIVRHLNLKGESESTVKIDHTSCDNIYIRNFQGDDVSFYDIRNRNPEESKFQITNSKFDGDSFMKVLFNTFNDVNLYRNQFENAVFSSCTFPKYIHTVENIHYPNKKEEDYAGTQYELYRQLKFSLNNNNNQLQALDMHQRQYNSIAYMNDLSGQDKFILFLNRISNNHNTSIKRAFFLAISLIIILWILYCLFLPNAPFKLGWAGIDSHFRAIGDFSVFLLGRIKDLTTLANPVHNTNILEKLNEGEVNSLSSMNYVISFVSRVLVAWAYFQFISAFRKFGRKL